MSILPQQFETESLVSYLSFKLGDELFAADVKNIHEILEVPKIRQVPRSPDYLKGVINLRGTVLPVIDSRIKFHLDEIQFTQDTCVIVIEIEVEGEFIKIGALVDAVLEVMEVAPDQIQPSPSLGGSYNPEFIRGVINYGEEFIMLLDIGKVFSTEDVNLLNEFTDEDGDNKPS